MQLTFIKVIFSLNSISMVDIRNVSFSAHMDLTTVYFTGFPLEVAIPWYKGYQYFIILRF